MEIKVPEVGESVTEATVVALLKKSGDHVTKGEEIVELETDKVNSVITAPESGILELKVTLEQKVKPTEVIGSIKVDAKSSETKSAPTPPPAAAAPPMPKGEYREPKEEFLKEKERVVAPAPSPKKGNRKKMSSLRKTIASHLVRVKNETAMLTTFNEVDMTEIMRIRDAEKEAFLKKHGVKLGFMSFFIKAAVSSLKAFSDVAASIDGDDIVYPESLGIGIAVSTERGLMVPVLKGCESMSFAAIEKELASYAEKARKGAISLDDLKGGCFTITNGGVFGSMLSTPIINAGQSAILGMHAIQKRVVVYKDEVAIRPMMYLALSYDHRIIDGKEAIGFLVHMKELLEEPSRFLLEADYV
jgi:2-oxoglutarate dehydrogenase E2 component (dihydrolipoamide succinyltransferase)